jgi:hypothetical protein
MNLLSLIGPRLDNICRIRQKWYYSSGWKKLQTKPGLGLNPPLPLIPLHLLRVSYPKAQSDQNTHTLLRGSKVQSLPEFSSVNIYLPASTTTAFPFKKKKRQPPLLQVETTRQLPVVWTLRPSLVSRKFYKIFQIPRHVESLDTCMKH